MIGQHLAQFRITARLGEGGMGEVYRAEDTKLGREVAIKVLPESFHADPERVARFEREARVLASLDHPNIAGIYEVGEAEVRPDDDGSAPEASTRSRSGAVSFLAMELAEGRTLAERLGDGALPLGEALEISVEIARALEAAHGRGIVHRDLKPANVVVDDRRRVKVLDFGLAKAFDSPAESGSDLMLSHSPTITAGMTVAGVILGTAAYMSPEQAKGEEADRRSDNWSFGVVLWEMLTGQRAFSQKTVSETLAAVLMREPDLAALPAATPFAVRRLLERCLQKDPERRLHDIADARIELEAVLRGEGSEPPTTAAATAGGTALGWKILSGLLVAVLGLAALELARVRAAPKVVRALVKPPPETRFYLNGANPGPVSLSPDGRRMAFTAVAGEGSDPTLWVRPIDSLVARELPGTEGARYPFWSPDGEFVAFFDGRALRKIAVAGGPPITLCVSANGKGGDWNAAGQIVFAPSPSDPLFVVSAAGGDPRQVTEILEGSGENSHRHPRFLPDGERFLYFVRRTDEVGVIRAGSLEGDLSRDIVRTTANAEFAAGRLLFVREGTLMAQRFDPGALDLEGEAAPVTENIFELSGASLAVFSTSAEGTLAYQTGLAVESSELLWVDRAGQVTAATAETSDQQNPRLSPGGDLAAVAIRDAESGNSDIWIWDLQRGIRNRLTLHPADDLAPTWSPDGERIAFSSARGKHRGEIWTKPIGGVGDAEMVAGVDRFVVPIDWSPDGALILAQMVGGPSDDDLFLVPADGGDPAPLFATRFSEVEGVISPDGRWIAYASDESGTPEVYVSTFPIPGRRWQVSLEGGRAPTWRGDGREIFFRGSGGIVSAEVDGSGQTFTVGRVERLFELHSRRTPGRDYDPTSDGQGILVHRSVQSEDALSITLVLNWDAELP